MPLAQCRAAGLAGGTRHKRIRIRADRSSPDGDRDHPRQVACGPHRLPHACRCGPLSIRRSFDVRPGFAATNRPNLSCVDAKRSSDLHMRARRIPHRSHERFRNGGPRMTLSADRAMSVLGHHVGDIVGLCSQEQVVWIDAGANVALVKDAESRRDWAAKSRPCEPVCLPIEVIEAHSPITLLGDYSLPQNATTRGAWNAVSLEASHRIDRPWAPSHGVPPDFISWTIAS